MTVSISIQYARREELEDLLTLGRLAVREDARATVLVVAGALPVLVRRRFRHYNK